MNQITDSASFALLAGEAGFEEELASFLGRLRYDRGDGPANGYRHGHRER